MGLKADIDEVTHNWSAAPWRVKVMLGLALFLSTSSLASLSETVFKWKGFILDGLLFYRAHFSAPLAKVSEVILHHKPPDGFIDAAVILGLFIGALLRVALFRSTPRRTKVGDVVTYVGVYVAMLFIFATQPEEPKTTSIWMLYPLFLLNAYMLTKGAARLLALAYMLIPVMAVAILAAIAGGIAR